MRFTLVKKLVLGFGAGVLITVIIVAFNYLQLGNLKKLQDIGFVKAHEAVLSKELSGMGYKLYQDIANFQINKNSVDNEKNWEELKNEFTADLENMKSASDTDEEKRWSNDANIKYLDMVKIVENEMLPLIKADADKNKIIALDDKIDGDLNDFNKILNDYSASIDRDMVNEDKNYDSTMSNVISVSIILTVIGVLLAVIMAYFITTSIRKDVGGEPSVISGITEQVSKGDLSIEFSSKNPTGILSSVINMVESLKIKSSTLEKISNGNLDVEVEMSSEKDELGKSMTRLVDSLNKIISQVNIAVEQVATGSTQVSAASQSLSQGATEQASSLEEITSSVGEINSQTIQNSENAVKANELSKNAMDNARKGNEQMNELVTSMNTINKSAQEIKKIVKAIDDIAFQINLLALNANVEAARAGKYGKGFAVVADEVRNLAVRSTGSLK
jgi:methyl-accepting chemotaxis protein